MYFRKKKCALPKIQIRVEFLQSTKGKSKYIDSKTFSIIDCSESDFKEVVSWIRKMLEDKVRDS